MNVVNWGIVGTGRMASLIMPAFQLDPDAKVVAVCSASKARAEDFAARHGGMSSYEGLEALLADKNIDAIYVATATADHARTSIAALKAGKHVLCEKPFAMTRDEGAAVISAAEMSGKLFMEGLWTHFLPAYERVFSAIQKKEVGKPIQLTTDFGYPTTAQLTPRLFQKNGGGVLLDRAVYPISLALRLLGDVKDLSVKTLYADDIDVHVIVQLQHETGAVSQLSASLISQLSNTASIACEGGLISILPPVLGAENVRFEAYGMEPATSVEVKQGLKARLKKNPVLRRVKTMLVSGVENLSFGEDQYRPQIQHFVHLIQAGKTQSNIVSHKLSLSVLGVIDQIRLNNEN